MIHTDRSRISANDKVKGALMSGHNPEGSFVRQLQGAAVGIHADKSVVCSGQGGQLQQGGGGAA